MTSPDATTVAAGDLHWFDGFLLKVLLPAEATEGRLSICEQQHPVGYGTPVHVHRREDQTLHVLEGRITAWLDPDGEATEHTVEAGQYGRAAIAEATCSSPCFSVC